jgi:BirA family transcriptional regulator, biotin operon repressor / biotin---[acetyl-CoA-carboxylase] ligase
MPGNLVSATLRRGLYTRVVGKRILFFQELGSTMDEAARQAAAGAAQGTVVVAEMQRASRGRLGRSWVSQPGNLYLSVLLYPAIPDLPYLNSLGGVAVARAISKTIGRPARLKWPNDVLLAGKKAAGILVESAINGDSVRHAIIGIGINVSLDTNNIEELSSFATSLNAVAEQEVPRGELLGHLLHQLDALYLQLRGGQTPLAEWQGLLDTLGQRVRVSWQDESYIGLAEGVDSTGNLQLRLDNGRLVTLTAGDVTLQPASAVS